MNSETPEKECRHLLDAHGPLTRTRITEMHVENAGHYFDLLDGKMQRMDENSLCDHAVGTGAHTSQ